MEGWIKLHRKFNDWQWAKSPNHVALFVCLLTRANHKETKWRTEVIKPGQLLTGRKQLSDWTGLSERQIRTVLKDLKISGEIDQQTTRHYSIITIPKWNTYQLSDQQTTSRRPADDQLTTTSKNANNEKNEENIIQTTVTHAVTPDTVVQIWNNVLATKLGYSHGLGVGEHLKNFFEARQFLDTSEKWTNYFEKISSVSFLLGESPKAWKVTLQWAVNYDNALKVLDGLYDKASGTQNALDLLYKAFNKEAVCLPEQS
jgi:biotin operon repressor